MKNYTIAVLGSHSALDVCRGAKDLEFKTLVVCEKGREKTYQKYYKNIVDECIILDKFSDILSEKIQKQLLDRNCIFIPHRSFEVYINDYDAIEKKFTVPMFGNRKLLRYEERNQKLNQYDLLDKANIRYPKQFKNPKDIDRLCIVKVLEKQREYERAFFLVNSYAAYRRESARLLKAGKITKDVLQKAVIEEFIIGVQVNFNFFYSPIKGRLELLGTDTRRQTNLEGFSKIPFFQSSEILEYVQIKYEEAGHIAVTVLESLLEDSFEIGERFVKATKKFYKQGIIGPFALQTMIIPGPPKKEIIVFDVSPRMPGSPGISATPYSGYLYGQNISMGKRVAMEIKDAVEKGELSKIIS